MLPSSRVEADAARLTTDEGQVLGALLRGTSREEIAARQGWRRDTLDKRITALRDRMGYENTGLLLHELARASAAKQFKH
jgi:DNA-binding NarL/FixJ family response regulator